MIIIKIIFLYFIEIAHTNDFPSTGTRLVTSKTASEMNSANTAANMKFNQ